jgi:hypothetical protein
VNGYPCSPQYSIRPFGEIHTYAQWGGRIELALRRWRGRGNNARTSRGDPRTYRTVLPCSTPRAYSLARQPALQMRRTTPLRPRQTPARSSQVDFRGRTGAARVGRARKRRPPRHGRRGSGQLCQLRWRRRRQMRHSPSAQSRHNRARGQAQRRGPAPKWTRSSGSTRPAAPNFRPHGLNVLNACLHLECTAPSPGFTNFTNDTLFVRNVN